MEPAENKIPEENKDELTVNLSKQSLKKIERANDQQREAEVLLLDRNEIHGLDNLDSFINVKRLSLAHNRLIRMEGISCMVNVTVLDISNNSLVCIEGLRDLKHLKQLNLSGNKIKTIDHLNYNINLENLNLSHNIIGHISDISFLQNLKELLLHNNEIAHLRQCEKNLPTDLEVLSLNHNCITDLNEISHLVMLRSLKELSISDNPCLESADSRIDFNHRPFVKNWCTSVLILDGYPLDDIECLKAEWLYSQGRGRSFRPGEHVALAKYLTGVCPRTETNVESEDEKKLRLILSKAQHHQQQLKEQVTGNTSLPIKYKLAVNRKKYTPMSERMVSSYHDAMAAEVTQDPTELMSRSMDCTLMQNNHIESDISDSFQSPLETATTLLPVPESLTSPDVCRPLHPFPAASPNPKLSFPLTASYPSKTQFSSSKVAQISALDSKTKTGNILKRYTNNNNTSPQLSRKTGKTTSPSKNSYMSVKSSSPKMETTLTTTVSHNKNINGKGSSGDESELYDIKVKKYTCPKTNKKQVLDLDEKENIEKTNKKNRKNFNEIDLWKAALCIQRHWRGYRTRNLNREVIETYKNIQTIRIQDYIIKVANDMEATKVALEGHRKLQVLQMQAINALWKKMVALQPGVGITPSSENKNTLQGLAETCMNLNKQVEELQNMMKVMHRSNQSHSIPMATQTEIVAVHTPQEEGKDFPYKPRLERPSILQVCEQYDEQFGDIENQLESNLLCDNENTTTVDAGHSSKGNECGIYNLENTTAELNREESVCLTPACQEGKDLQSMFMTECNQ